MKADNGIVGSNITNRRTSFRSLLGFAALAMFAGVRPEELKRSPRDVIDVNHGTIVVTGGRAKTRKRRVVDLSKNCVAWLKLWMRLCPEQRMIIPKNFRVLWELLREASGLKPLGWRAKRSKKHPPSDTGAVEPWPSDVLRHTFATMHLALHQNIAVLQVLLGHSKDEDTLFAAYRAVRLLTAAQSAKRSRKNSGRSFRGLAAIV
jgi:integrase